VNLTVPVALFGTPAVLFVLFGIYRSRRALLTGFILGWLLLPMAAYPLGGGVEYTKIAAVGLGLLLAVAVFDPGRILAFRPSWLDLPIVVWCLSPFVSSVLNGLGPVDGIGAAVHKILHWGIPYFLGRISVSGVDGLRDLTLAILAGGLLYLPLCLFEARMSPQLHTWIYGYHQHSFAQAYRFGGWRPVVFLPHGLAVGLWMAVATLVSVWLWRTRSVDRIARVPIWAWSLLLGATTLLCRSAGAVILLAAGLAVLLAVRWTRSTWPAFVLLALPLLYMGIRISGAWDGKEAIELAGSISPERAESLQYRLRAEDVLVRHALRKPAFGWGGWSRNRPSRFDEEQEDVATDGLWVIALGAQGLTGMLAWAAFLSVPAIGFALRVPGRAWSHPRAAPGSALVVVLLLYLCDGLMNAMTNPVFLLVAGALAGTLARAGRTDPPPEPA
jgi:hypothetical protein